LPRDNSARQPSSAGRDRAGNPGGSHCLVARTGDIDSAPAIAVTSRLLINVSAVLMPSHRLQPDVIVMPNMVQLQWNSTFGIDRRLPGVAEVATYRVFEESLTNSAKQSQASVVEGRAESWSANLNLRIRGDVAGRRDPRRLELLSACRGVRDGGTRVQQARRTCPAPEG
jgi:hypothetical protein